MALLTSNPTQRIQVTEPKTGQVLDAFPTQPLLSSQGAGWNHLVLEEHRLPPVEVPEVVQANIHISVQTGSPLELEWRTNGRFKRVPLTPDRICFSPAGVSGNLRWTQPSQCVFLALDPNALAVNLPDYNPSAIELAEVHGQPDPVLSHIALALRAELQQGTTSGPLLADTLVSAMAIHIAGRYASQTYRAEQRVSGLSAVQRKLVTDYMADHLGESIKLADLAQLVHMSSFHFARCFKRATGQAPHQHLVQQRIDKAKELLRHSGLSLTDIALTVGLSEQSHLNRLFRKATGVTPLAYRQQRR
ncbi:AraC family transcriptional regulator [Spirosoma soli]|uniref:AraC family transcriptional regulator n=1 Tax=Spirosoma soli TaxID=1770529 RepID=A0ABW5M4P3_9BACT